MLIAGFHRYDGPQPTISLGSTPSRDFPVPRTGQKYPLTPSAGGTPTLPAGRLFFTPTARFPGAVGRARHVLLPGFSAYPAFGAGQAQLGYLVTNERQDDPAVRPECDVRGACRSARGTEVLGQPRPFYRLAIPFGRAEHESRAGSVLVLGRRGHRGAALRGTKRLTDPLCVTRPAESGAVLRHESKPPAETSPLRPSHSR